MNKSILISPKIINFFFLKKFQKNLTKYNYQLIVKFLPQKAADFTKLSLYLKSKNILISRIKTKLLKKKFSMSSLSNYFHGNIYIISFNLDIFNIKHFLNKNNIIPLFLLYKNNIINFINLDDLFYLLEKKKIQKKASLYLSLNKTILLNIFSFTYTIKIFSILLKKLCQH